jgi:PAS domain S-box-containing protein
MSLVEKKLVGNTEQNLREMIAATPSCLKIVDKEGRLLAMNPQGIQLIEAPDEDSVVGADVYSLVQEDHRERFIELNRKVCSGQNGHLIFEIIGLGGTRRWMETHAAPYALTNGEYAQIAITNDITEKVEREREIEHQRQALVHSARLASLGEMAGGIAHEINNPLGIIMGTAGHLKLHMRRQGIQDELLEEGFDRIEETVRRISSIIRGLRNFSRDASDEDFKAVRISDIVQETLELTREKVKNNNVDLQCSMDVDAVISCQPVQISQVIMNLLINSMHAVSSLEEKWISIEAEQTTDGYLKLKITDSGKGISPEHQSKIMEPFYTTKPVGQGTGLGLSISAGIIKTHNGTLDLNAQSPNTQFVITLPIVDEENE